MLNRGIYRKRIQKKSKGGIGVGTSMILVVFVLFCLITFAALSYVTARADYSKTVQGSELVCAYYEAVSGIETEISELDFSGVQAGIVYEFSEKIDDSRSLNVTIVTTGDISKPYKVKRWSTEDDGRQSGATFEDQEGGMNLLF